MEAMLEKLIGLGWELSIRYESGTYSISIWEPERVTDNIYQAVPCPIGKGNTWDEAVLNLMAILLI